jgi:hypothetical protein
MTDDLKRFIEGFEDEDALRRAVEALLIKMPGCTNVRATHGSQEKGKDIVFRSRGPMDEVVLNACIIKNEKITGSADSSSGARTVFHQVEQALDTPILDEQGRHETVARAYVISPHECSIPAIESVEGKLQQRSGQVVFMCGNDLLSKFKKYLPEYLLANLKFLGAHIRSMRDRLDKDPSVARLLFKEGFSTTQPSGLGAMYVRPRLACTLRTHRLSLDLPKADDFERRMAEQEAARLAAAFRNLAALLLAGWPLKLGTGDNAEGLARDAVKFANDLQEVWAASFGIYRSQPERTEQEISRGRSVAILLSGAPSLRDRSTKITERAGPFIDTVHWHVARSNKLSNTDFTQNPLDLFRCEGIQDFSIISDLSRRVPSVVVAARSMNKVTFSENLLGQMPEPLLITGPAGYGKTSFCRWNALRDLEALEKNKAKILPVYIQLHKLPDRPLVTFQQAFLDSEELTAVWKELHQGQTRDRWTLRVYLDGLDEVPSEDRRIEIARVAATGVAGGRVQVIVTARDHVSGPWLSWLRRLELQPFNEGEVLQLVGKWLDADQSKIGAFYEKLRQLPSLASLMKVPLLGTLILAVYKHGHEDLPESRPRLYEMFVRLLAGGWDAAKNVNRGSKFNSPTKVSVLSQLAGSLHAEKRRDCTIQDVRLALEERVSLRDRAKVVEILHELIVDGLLVPTGSTLSFPHLSFQEFLAAKDLVQIRPDRANQRLDAFLKGDDWWREVLTFYVGFHDKPAEMEEWIRAGALRTLARTSDDVVRSRAIDLCQTIMTNFPSFRFSRDTEGLLGWSSESAFRLGKTRSPTPSARKTVS